MSFFDKWEAAIENKDLDGMVELMHSEWTMVMHSTGKVIHLDEWKDTFCKMIASDKFPTSKQVTIKALFTKSKWKNQELHQPKRDHHVSD